jgi:hypothetical protein
MFIRFPVNLHRQHGCLLILAQLSIYSRLMWCCSNGRKFIMICWCMLAVRILIQLYWNLSSFCLHDSWENAVCWSHLFPSTRGVTVSFVYFRRWWTCKVWCGYGYLASFTFCTIYRSYRSFLWLVYQTVHWSFFRHARLQIWLLEQNLDAACCIEAVDWPFKSVCCSVSKTLWTICPFQ